MAKTRKVSRKKTPLDGLQPDEAAAVLKSLLANHPELLPEAERIWRSTLDEVSFDLIAFDVETAIRQLDIDDLNDRAGSHSWGYVEPSQAAQDLLEEAVAPSMEELNRKKEAGLDEAAFEICKGVVFGLYQCRESSGDGVLGWAADFPAEAAAYAVDTWTGAGKLGAAGKKPRKQLAILFREFVGSHVPEWDWLSKRVG